MKWLQPRAAVCGGARKVAMEPDKQNGRSECVCMNKFRSKKLKISLTMKSENNNAKLIDEDSF